MRGNYKKYAFFLTQFITGQFFLQVINLLNGIFLLRWLSIEQQAKFSVAFGIQSLILNLSDMGVTGSVISLTGNRINDKETLGAYILAGRKIRKFFFVISCTIIICIVPLIVHAQTWGYKEMFFVFLPVVVAIFGQMKCSLYDTTLIMHKQMGKFYAPQIGVAIFKFISNYLLYLGGIINSITTLFLNATGYIFNGIIFKKKAQQYFSPTLQYDKEYKEMLNYIKPQILSTIFFAFYGQIQIFLISFFGKTVNIAEVAALGRLGQVFVFLNVANSVVITPFIAKASREILFKKYVLCIVCGGVVCAFMFCIAFFFPHLLTFLLGEKYEYLQNLYTVIVFNACLSYITLMIYCMNTARKWVFWWNNIANIFGIIIVQIVGMLIFDMSKTEGVLLLARVTTLVTLAINVSTTFFGFQKRISYSDDK